MSHECLQQSSLGLSEVPMTGIRLYRNIELPPHGTQISSHASQAQGSVPGVSPSSLQTLFLTEPAVDAATLHPTPSGRVLSEHSFVSPTNAARPGWQVLATSEPSEPSL